RVHTERRIAFLVSCDFHHCAWMYARDTGPQPFFWITPPPRSASAEPAPPAVSCSATRDTSAVADYGPAGSAPTLSTVQLPPRHSRVLKHPLSCGSASGSPSVASSATSTWRFT